MAIGSRLRMLTEKITSESAQIYRMYGVDLQPKWFPVYYVLAEGGAKTITAIAEEIGHSHPSVSKIVKEMAKHGLIVKAENATDKRQNRIALSEKGLELNVKIQAQYTDVNAAIDEMLSQTQHNLWKAMEEWEFLLNQKQLARRVMEQRKIREARKVRIVDYEPEYQAAFRELNVQWISKYFKMEVADYKALDNPDDYILKNGGHILVALYDGEPLGVCALIKMDDLEFDYELAKMAVSPRAQGKNIGYLLGKAICEKAVSLGAKSLYLESNTVLEPAINLYHKLGFQKIAGRPTPYERCNIQMALQLKTIEK